MYTTLMSLTLKACQMIKYNDLKKINSAYEPMLTEAVTRAAASGWYISGEEGKRFENGLIY